DSDRARHATQPGPFVPLQLLTEALARGPRATRGAGASPRGYAGGGPGIDHILARQEYPMKRSGFAQPSRARAIFLALAAIALLAMAMPAFAQPAHVIVRLPTGAQEPAQLSELLSSWRQSGHTSNITRIDSD